MKHTREQEIIGEVMNHLAVINLNMDKITCECVSKNRLRVTQDRLIELAMLLEEPRKLI
jgi:hypothetical protein